MSKTSDEFIDSTNNVATRVYINTKYGDNNLREWVPKQLELKQGEKVLDVGCGLGSFLGALNNDIEKYAIDESQFVVDYIKNKFKNSFKGISIFKIFIH